MILASILSMGFLNRLRGSGYTPIDGRWFCAPILLALMWSLGVKDVAGGPLASELYVACWLLWAFPPWARWMTLGNTPLTTKTPTWFENAIDVMGGNIPWACLLIRHMICLIPFMVLFRFLPFFVLGPAIVWCYWFGWSVWKVNKTLDPIAIAEPLVGVCFGLATWSCLP